MLLHYVPKQPLRCHDGLGNILLGMHVRPVFHWFIHSLWSNELTDRPDNCWTTWSRVLEKLGLSQLAKKFSAFYGIQKFITVVTGAHLSRSIQCLPCHSISLRPRLILFHLCRGPTGGLFPSGFSIKTMYAPLPHACHMACLSRYSLLDYPDDIWWGVQILKLLIVQYYVVFLFFPPRPICLPQHPVLEHTQPAVLPQCKRPRFTPI